MRDRVFLCRPDKDLKEWKEHPWIDVKFNGENIEKCTFFGSLQIENVDGNGKRQHWEIVSVFLR